MTSPHWKSGSEVRSRRIGCARRCWRSSRSRRLTLAIVGLYGTLSYAVTVRRREIGLRLALGALRTEIVRQFLGQGLRVVGLGLPLWPGRWSRSRSARVLSRMLYGVSPSDPLTLSIVMAIVLAVAASRR